jgi:DNA-binding beta-propeller fold protein YncE
MRNLLAVAIGLTLGAGLTVAHAAPAYVLAHNVPLGAPDRWDYVVFDAPSGRVYVAHGDTLAVIDGATARLIGQVEEIAGGTHGTGISQAAGQGFTDDGRNGQVVAFDLQTLKVVKRIAVDADADGVAADPVSGHIFVVEGDPAKIKVIDPKTDAVTATIAGGEKMEYIAADGLGAVFVAGEEKRDLLKVDVKTNTVTARWPMPDCQSPHGLAVDAAGHRAFMSCVNSLMMVIDTQSGRLVAKLPIGRGSDAAAFDPVRKRAFSANGLDGTISVYQQRSPDLYEALDPIHTAVSARTMAVDPQSGRLFLAGADVDPPASSGGRPRPRPGTLRLMILEPAAP